MARTICNLLQCQLLLENFLVLELYMFFKFNFQFCLFKNSKQKILGYIFHFYKRIAVINKSDIHTYWQIRETQQKVSFLLHILHTYTYKNLLFEDSCIFIHIHVYLTHILRGQGTGGGVQPPPRIRDFYSKNFVNS